MRNQHTLSPHHRRDEDPVVARARHKEVVRGAIKMLRVVMDAVRRHAEWVEARHGLSASELWALWELEQTPGLRAVDLAKAMAVHRTTAEALLHALETRGLAQHTAREDEHASGHYLTEAGKHLAQATPDHGPGILKTALEQLPEATLNQLVDSLKPMVENMPFREDRAALKPMADLLHLAASRGKA